MNNLSNNDSDADDQVHAAKNSGQQTSPSDAAGSPAPVQPPASALSTPPIDPWADAPEPKSVSGVDASARAGSEDAEMPPIGDVSVENVGEPKIKTEQKMTDQHVADQHVADQPIARTIQLSNGSTSDPEMTEVAIQSDAEMLIDETPPIAMAPVAVPQDVVLQDVVPQGSNQQIPLESVEIESVQAESSQTLRASSAAGEKAPKSFQAQADNPAPKAPDADSIDEDAIDADSIDLDSIDADSIDLDSIDADAIDADATPRQRRKRPEVDPVATAREEIASPPRHQQPSASPTDSPAKPRAESQPPAQKNVSGSSQPQTAPPVVNEPAAAEKSADAASPPVEYAPGEVPFAELPLADEVRRAVELAGYRVATAIQSAIIPPMVERRDVLAQSQTGSGKTAAFALPVLTNIDTRDRSIQCLVLTPTRELAVQVSRSFTGYGEEVRGLNVTAIYGGQDYQPQLRALQRGSQIVVGTPGRVIDHIKRGSLDLSKLQTLVLDEADEMLNMGFLEDVEFVLQQTPPTRQIALFSATMPGPIAHLSKRYLNDPVHVSIGSKKLTAESICQRAVFVAPRDKLRLLKRFLETEATEGVIVFVKTRESTVTLAESLVRDGFSAAAINGDMPQNVRERTIAHLKSGRLNVLVATDVAARGLDVQRITHVFNFDLPHDSESYVHRIGRTGRAGRSGEAIIFLSNSQRHRLRTISRLTGQDIEVISPPAVEDVNSRRAEAFAEKIETTIKTEDLTLLKELVDQHVTASGQSIQDVAAALAHLNQRGRPFFLNEDPIGPTRGRRDDERGSRGGNDGEDDGDQRGGKRHGPPGSGMVRYRLAVGLRDNIHVGNIVGAVANEAGLTNSEIGPIKIHESFSTIDLPEGMPGDVFETLQRTRVGGRPLAIREWSDAPPRGRSGGGPSGNTRPGGARPNGGRPGGKPGGGKPSGFAGKPKSFRKKFDGPPSAGKRKKK